MTSGSEPCFERLRFGKDASPTPINGSHSVLDDEQLEDEAAPSAANILPGHLGSKPVFSQTEASKKRSSLIMCAQLGKRPEVVARFIRQAISP
jgi:hypothetical protein